MLIKFIKFIYGMDITWRAINMLLKSVNYVHLK